LKLLILYLGLAFIGYLVGNKILPKKYDYKWITMVQTIAVIILIFTMGARIGADKEIIGSMGEIGVISFVLTIFSITGSVVMVLLLRKILKTDRWGNKVDD
jgi:uncharacterized membrane protein